MVTGHTARVGHHLQRWHLLDLLQKFMMLGTATYMNYKVVLGSLVTLMFILSLESVDF